MEQTYSIEIIQPSDLENLSTQDNVIELTDVGIIGLDSLCRLCANRSDHLIPIYEGEGLDYQLEVKINRHFPFTVERTDTLPTHCCYQCASTLLTWHELIETSIEADRRLKALEFDTVVQFNHKLENLEDTAQQEVISEETTEIYEEAQETENISDISTNDQQRVAQLRAAAVTAGRLLSFRQAQSNFTVDYFNQSNSTKICTTSENLKEEQIFDDKIENQSGIIKKEELSQPNLSALQCTKVKRKIKTLKQNPSSRILRKKHNLRNYLQISDKLIKNDKLVKIQTINGDKLTNDDKIVKTETYYNDNDKLAKTHTNKSDNYDKLVQTQTNNSDNYYDKLVQTQTDNSDYNDKLIKTQTNNSDNDKLAKIETTKEYLCVFCDEIFQTKKLLNTHKYEKHGFDDKGRVINKDEIDNARVIIDKRIYYQCKECGKNLHSPYTYMWHRRIHTGERPYVCDLCGKQFRVSQGLVRHLRETHAGIKNFPCDICGRMFGTRRNVDEHRRIHTNERPYVCALCGKSFKQKASLFVHTRSHSDNFPHKCTYCGQGFRTKAPLLIHVTRHTGEKPYSCEICGRCFRIKYELKGHKLIHSDVKPFHCVECGISFRQKRYLRNHNKVKHNICDSNNQTVP